MVDEASDFLLKNALQFPMQHLIPLPSLFEHPYRHHSMNQKVASTTVHELFFN